MTDKEAAAAGETPDEAPPFSLRETLRDLYFGADKRAARFQYTLVVVDVTIIVFFLTVTFVADQPWLLWVDLFLAALLALDVAARLYIAQHPLRYLFHWITIADIIVVVSLVLPIFTGDLDNLAFLRVLRAVRLARSYHLFESLKRQSQWFRQHEDPIQASSNMLIFLFVTTGVVYVHEVEQNPLIETYLDALYFTVATLSTTGFGDITLTGQSGKLLAVLIMIVGVSLFVRLVKSVFVPSRVNYRCPTCGLLKHEPDAVHCKHCGEVLAIPTEGRIG